MSTRRPVRPALTVLTLRLTAMSVLVISLLAPVSARAASCPPGSKALVVVKVAQLGRAGIAHLTSTYPVQVSDPLVPSRGIWELVSTDPTFCGTKDSARKLADRIKKDPTVVYADASYLTALSDRRFHAWPSGPPTGAGQDPRTWREQPVVSALRLPEVHGHSQGSGAVVAVLDTGVADSHPALAGALDPGWDYVDDDASPQERRNGKDDDGDGQVDESFGHGTFISGIVTLVAPGAKVMPMRVLDSDGEGNTFVVAQAIDDAVEAGANVISMSFGGPDKPDSHVLNDAVKRAEKAGVVVVAAAGNAGTETQQYPAADDDVVSVGALTTDSTRLADFSNSGGWVDVAAPGEHVAGPVPGGGYAWWSGTSIATPFVAGQLALLGSERSNDEAHKLVDAVRHTATRLSPKGYAKVNAIDILRSLTVH